MKKTKKEILTHLEKVAYTKPARCKILGFLVAIECAEVGERIYFKPCEADTVPLTFKDFMMWYEDTSEQDAIIISLLTDLYEVLRDAWAEDDHRTSLHVHKQLQVVCNLAGMDFDKFMAEKKTAKK